MSKWHNRKINICLTDRAPVNHATISLIEKEWQKKIISINCNLHPLETISSTVRAKLVQFEDDDAKAIFHGAECLAWKIIINMNRLRFSDKKGNVKEFRNFLVQEN